MTPLTFDSCATINESNRTLPKKSDYTHSKTENSYTKLFYDTVKSMNVEIIQNAIKNDYFDVNFSKDGKTPLDIALENNNIQVINILSKIEYLKACKKQSSIFENANKKILESTDHAQHTLVKNTLYNLDKLVLYNEILESDYLSLSSSSSKDPIHIKSTGDSTNDFIHRLTFHKLRPITEKEFIELINKILKQKQTLDISGTFGYWNKTPLQNVALLGNSDMINTLITKGATVDYHENDNTPLYYAALHQNIGAAKKLIELGADVNFVNEEGESILDAALRSWNDLSVATFLLELDKLKVTHKHVDAYERRLAGNEHDPYYCMQRPSLQRILKKLKQKAFTGSQSGVDSNQNTRKRKRT